MKLILSVFLGLTLISFSAIAGGYKPSTYNSGNVIVDPMLKFKIDFNNNVKGKNTIKNEIEIENNTTNYQNNTKGGDSSVNYKNQQAASSAAPIFLTTTSDTCMGSSGLGGQGMTFGFSVGTTWRDEGCDARSDARTLKSQGHDEAAKVRLCMKSEIYEAFKHTKSPCPKALEPTVLAGNQNFNENNSE